MIELLDEGNKTKLAQYRRYFACPVAETQAPLRFVSKSPVIISWINVLFWAGLLLMISFVFSI
jgi:hypothetical protein